jgi:hypothetical protein
MARKSTQSSRCAVCGAKDVSEPRGDARYCQPCWDKKIAIEDIVSREFTLKRYIRAQQAEKLYLYHATRPQPIGQVQVIDDGYDLFMTLLLYPTFDWDEPAYHLERDVEQRTFAQLMVDLLVGEIVEPWGGGKWHLEVFRSAMADPDSWNGEL